MAQIGSQCACVDVSIEAKERQREAVIESNKQRAENPCRQKIADMDHTDESQWSAVRAAN